MTEDDFALPPASAVFVDVPNVNRGGRHGTLRRSLHWSPLIERISDDLVGTELSFAGAYAYIREEANAAAGRIRNQMEHKFGKHGLTLEVRHSKDIDSWIINDIWANIVGNQQFVIKKFGKMIFPIQVRHILVSGDGGYLRPYRALRNLFGDRIELQLIVYAWNSEINAELADFADGVRYLNDLTGFESLTTRPVRA